MEIHVIDAFTDRPFRGNPAAVLVMDRYPSDAALQQIAMEMNLSETAFLCKENDGLYRLRWFTPEVEVDLCGHATLASAHHLWESGAEALSQPLSFMTLSGLLTAVPLDNGWIQLDFPSEPVSAIPVTEQLLSALGLSEPPRFAGNNRLDVLIELDSAQAVHDLNPDFAAIASWEGVRGVLVTARSEDLTLPDGVQVDFVSRCFFPAIGINEDPVTSSAHCALTPYWQTKLGKHTLCAMQLSARTGILQLQVAGDRIKLAGQAVTVLKGTLQLSLP
ncbi:PhzF family phenazine biosynthesis protein [Paenibacillus allorhizosphaerae]|uniref:PhzF family phenazine biosynthesis protein n=1 Tax=Paenibacillus allorhizosphaerae TaxID=2849866 RepID=A0ABN7U077_9BACL|nr:PhzF family phenazine biosynthesis protein [Paenibacillus allorhizosphaerae]CAG7657729.1 hypothetical protein PAECIP111802_06843 [Paenibacillus allorhizosphaerae]